MEFKSFQETEIGMDKEKKPVVYTAAAVLAGCFVYAVQIRFPLWWLFAGALIGIALFIRLAFFTRPKGRWSRTFMLVDPDLIWLRIDFARLEPIFWSNDARKHDFVYFLDPKRTWIHRKGNNFVVLRACGTEDVVECRSGKIDPRRHRVLEMEDIALIVKGPDVVDYIVRLINDPSLNEMLNFNVDIAPVPGADREK